MTHENARIASLVLLITLVAVGAAGSFLTRQWVQRRRFYRRNEAGVEVFPSYASSVRARWLEGAMMVSSRLLVLLAVLSALGLIAVWSVSPR